MSIEAYPGTVPDLTAGSLVGLRCQVARILAGYEKQELAALIGVSDSTIANYEKLDWAKERRDKTLWDWADVCNVNRAWLKTGVPGPDVPGPGKLRRLAPPSGLEPETLRLMFGGRHPRLSNMISSPIAHPASPEVWPLSA